MAGESVGVRAVIDSSPAKAGADAFNTAMGTMRDSATKTAGKINELTGATSILKGGLAALGAAFAIRGIVEAADDITRLKVRMEALTGSAESGAQALSKIKAVARDSRTSTSDLAAAYGVMHGQLKDTNTSQDDAIRSLGLLSKSMQLGGASADDIRGALDGLSRAFVAGRLEGGHFIRLMETAPLLMQKMQQMTGLSARQLRAWANDGKVTGSTIVSVLSAAADDIDDRFKTMPRTMSGAFSQVADALTKTLGEAFSNGEGGSKRFIEAMDALRDTMRSQSFKDAAKDAADAIGWIVEKAIAGTGKLKEFGEWAGQKLYNFLQPEAVPYRQGLRGFADAMTPLGSTKAAAIGPFQTTVQATGASQQPVFEKGRQELELEKTIDLEKQQAALVRARVIDSREVVAQLEADLAVRSRVTDEMKKIYPELAKQYEAQIRNTEAAKMHAQILAENKQIARGFGDTLTDGLISGIKAGQSLGDTFRDITAKIIEMIAKVTILNPLLNQIGKKGGSLLSGVGFDSEKGLFGEGMPLASLGSFFGFADGGSFRVGGSGGTDSQLVAFKASPDETVSITRPDQRGSASGGAPSVVFNVAGDMTDETAAKVQGMIEATWAQRSPKLINASVDAVRDRHVRDRKFLNR